WREALLSADGRRLLCRWRGAPASVATVMGEAGFDAVQPWRGLALDLGHGTANVVVEDESTDGRPIRSIFPYDRLGPCLLAYRVTPVRVVISLDGCHLRAFYHAPDAES